MKTYELLSDKTKWTKNHTARDKGGYSIEYDNSSAVCWCMLGAINKCYFDETDYFEYSKNKSKVSKLLHRLGYEDIAAFNDDPNTTYEDVIKVLKKADI